MTVTSQQKLLAACPCLNVKLHLASELEKGVSLAGKELKLGIAGVSVEQKILCNLSISKDHATARCSNCDLDIYTYKPNTTSVNLEQTPLAYLASSILYSPSDGIVIPTDAVITGEDIAARLDNSNYSHAFRLVLEVSPVTAIPESGVSDFSAVQQKQSESPYRPHLEKVRNILEKELESNLNAQQQKTEARIEAYKSQQMIALQKSIDSTKQEKERLWTRIQECVTALPTSLSTSESGVIGNNSDGSLNISNDGSHQTFLEVPGTLPVRFTSTSPQKLFLDRKSSNSDVAMSLQLREFDQRLASNSMRRQSLVSANITPPGAVNDDVDQTQSNTTANATTSIIEDQPSTTTLETETSSPTVKPKKKVTISDSVNQFSAVEPEGANDGDYDDQDDDEEDDDEEGVVFELDEELGFDDDGKKTEDDDDDDDEAEDNNELDDNANVSTSNGISIKSSGQSLPKQTGMVVGSLRANYLRRQKGLRQHKQSLKDDELDFDDDEDDGEYVSSSAAAASGLLLGTSLPIQIQPRPANLPQPPPTTRTSAITNSLALPPGSSPAAAMLQRRLSRAYGTDIPSDINSKMSRSSLSGSLIEAPPSALAPTPGATANSVIIDPLMLLEEDHDEEENEERLRKNKQPFSAINYRRDQERRGSHQPPNQEHSNNGAPGPLGSSFAAQQSDFEPPHLYSARTYVGSTPWEMPSRITTKTSGLQREGTHLDKLIAAEMAKELELERQEKEKKLDSSASSTVGEVNNISHNAVEGSDTLPPDHPFSTAGPTLDIAIDKSDS